MLRIYGGYRERLPAVHASRSLVDTTLAIQEVAVARPLLARGGLLLFLGRFVLAAPVAARLALGLERFPDHRGERVVPRPGAVHRLAAAPVDPQHAYAGGGAERQLFQIGEGGD